MELRPELMPPQLNEAKVKQLVELAHQVIVAMEQGQDTRLSITAFNAAACTDCNLEDFRDVYGSTGIETFVRGCLMPRPQRMKDITEAELLELIQRVGSAEYSEYETHFWLLLLERNVPHPAISDLIFWSNLEPEEILRQALEYKPIQL